VVDVVGRIDLLDDGEVERLRGGEPVPVALSPANATEEGPLRRALFA